MNIIKKFQKEAPVHRIDIHKISTSNWKMLRKPAKAKEHKRDPLLAILSWCNPPREGFSTSSVQRLMGRRACILLPTTEKLLQPSSDLGEKPRSWEKIVVQAV